MGLLSLLFGGGGSSRSYQESKSSYDREIARVQELLGQAQADLARFKAEPKSSARDTNIANTIALIAQRKSRIAELKAKRRDAPKG